MSSETSKKLTAREVADSVMLMTMIAPHKDKMRLAASALKGGSTEALVYDVRVSVNGIELDFREFAAEIQRQLDDMVRHEAGELVKQVIGRRLDDMVEDSYETLRLFNEGLQKKAYELLGIPRKED